MGGAIKAFQNIAKTVSNVAGSVVNIGTKALDILKKPMSAVLDPVAKFIGEKVGKLPFVGKFLGPIAENLFKQGATALLGGGPLGGLGFLAKLAPKLEDLVKVAETVKKTADNVGAFTENPVGLSNWQNIIAQRQGAMVE